MCLNFKKEIKSIASMNYYLTDNWGFTKGSFLYFP